MSATQDAIATSSPPQADGGALESAVGQAVGAAGRGQQRRAILASIIAETRPAPMPATWGFLGPSELVRELCGGPAALLASLRQKYSDDELRANRIINCGPDGHPVLAPVLIQPKLCIVIRRKVPVDIDTDVGSLFSRSPACFRIGLVQTKEYRPPVRAYLAGADDLQILKHLVGRSTTLAGLANLTGDQVRRLFAVQTDSAKPRFRLTLLNAQLAGLVHDTPCELSPILRHLWHVAELYYDQHEIFLDVWCPSPDDFDRLRTAVRFKDRALVKQLFRESVRRSKVSAVEAWNNLQEREELDLPTAYKELARAIQRCNAIPCPNAVRIALQKYLRAGERMRKRFLADSERAATSAKSGLILLSGKLRHYLHENQPIVRRARALIDGDYRVDAGPSVDELLVDYTRLANLFVKIDRHLTR